MIKLIIGTKGSGKTKAMVDMINNATKTTNGNVVVIEKCMNLTYHIDYKARLIDVDEYKISGYPMLYGFISGVLAGNYDITELFIDGILKVGGRDYVELGETLAAIDALAGENVQVIVTVSANEDELPDSVKKYL
ncbi:MAG: ATP-binding protein [Oscillospiraceae bacterium]|nr:ATP-binding protein [Oscillospiraceae bacterium]